MPTLFDPIQLGDLPLNNRIIMAPLTRCRASAGRVPNDLMREYYVQRASAGLIITEATSVTPMGVGYPDTPGIWSNEQIAGWRNITDAVHQAGGKIMLQLWHVGRVSDPFYLNGELPVAPSAIAPQGHVSLMRPKKRFVTPRALQTNEIALVIEAYRKGAENARLAGFDGVEIHGANGELSNSNESLLRIRWIALIRDYVDISIAATGGLHQTEDVLKALLVGADITHLCSVLLQKGPQHITLLKEEITNWLEEQEYDSVAQMKGSISKASAINPEELEHSNYMRVIKSYSKHN